MNLKSADRLESRIQGKNSMLALLGLLITVLTCGFGYVLYEQLNAKKQIKTELEQLRNEKVESDKLSQSKIESLESLVERQTVLPIGDSVEVQTKIDSTAKVSKDSTKIKE